MKMRLALNGPLGWSLVAAALVCFFFAAGGMGMRRAVPPPPWVEWRQLTPKGAPDVWRLRDRHAGVICYIGRAALACFADAELGAR